jgi:hypothetical protein
MRDSMAHWSPSLEIELTLRVAWYKDIVVEDVVEWAPNYADPSNPIGVPKSRHEGRLIEKGTIGKKAITPDSHLFCCAHFHVLQQMPNVSEYLDEHKEVLLRDNPECNESWLANEQQQ